MGRYTLVPLLVALVLAASVAAEPGTRSAQAASPQDLALQASPVGGITDVRFGDHITHERAVLDFRSSTTGAAPEFTWSYRPGDSVVRVRLPQTQATAVAGGPGLGRAISHYKVVRAKPGWLFVDLHLRGAARSVNVFELGNPGRIVVDVRPGAAQTIPSPAFANGTYVMSPRTGAAVGPGQVQVTGYGRPFEASGAWRLRDSSGQIVSRGIYTTADWTEAWGAYSFRATYPERLSGQRGTLQVGAFSPADGAFRGVAVPVNFR